MWPNQSLSSEFALASTKSERFIGCSRPCTIMGRPRRHIGNCCLGGGGGDARLVYRMVCAPKEYCQIVSNPTCCEHVGPWRTVKQKAPSRPNGIPRVARANHGGLFAAAFRPFQSRGQAFTKVLTDQHVFGLASGLFGPQKYPEHADFVDAFCSERKFRSSAHYKMRS